MPSTTALNKSLVEKVEELKAITSAPSFLETLVDPFGFLDELIPFAQKVFEELPPDSSLTFGQANDIRVFFIRLLSKFKYDGYHARGLLPMIYDLLHSENIFNRYLTLRILFPLLKADLKMDLGTHLRAINTFFRNELPVHDSLDNSRCELGFFASSEALNYLGCFQAKYNLGAEAYEEIFFSIAAALKIYFTQKYLDKYRQSKKIICEFCSMVIKLLGFTNLLSLPVSHFIVPFIPELCYTLSNIVPPDCYYLRKSALMTISSCFSIRKDILYNMDRYFLKNSFLSTDYVPLKIYNIGFLCDLLIVFNKSMTKIAFGEFDLRVWEYLPVDKNLPLLHACCSAFALNLSLIMEYPMDPADLRLLVLRQIKNAFRVFKLLHLPHTKVSKELDDFESPRCTEDEAVVKLMDYIKTIVRSLASLNLKPLHHDDAFLLSQLLLFPLSRNQCSREFYATFLELPTEDLEKVVSVVAEDLVLKYYQKNLVWGILAQNPEINCILIRQACHIIHGDLTTFTYRDIEFYRRIFPLAHGHFKLDKKYTKPEISEYFAVIFDYILHYSSNSCGITEKEMVSLVDSMFLEIKNCEVAYTGLYLIYSHFEETVMELYTLYNLSFDPFFLECLFNIPVSLNLLVTKYVVLIDPMAAGLRSSRKLREIVLKYIEYIIEFDNEEGLMDSLLLSIFYMLQDFGIKGINVLARISNKHRNLLCSGRIGTFRLMDTDELFSFSGQHPDQDGYSFVSSSKLDARDVEGLLNSGASVPDEAFAAGKNEPRHGSFRIGVDGLYRAMIKNLSGFEFILDSDQRQNPYSPVLSRRLRAVDVDPASREYARDVLLEYLINLLGLKDLSLADAGRVDIREHIDRSNGELMPVFCLFTAEAHPKCHLGYYQRIHQTVSDILLAFLIDDSEKTFNFLKLCVQMCTVLGSDVSARHYRQVFVGVLTDGLVYSGKRTTDVLKLLVESIDAYDSKLEVISSVLYALIDFVYSEDDLKSHRALCAILDIHEHIGFEMSPSPSKDIFHCLHFKLKKCQSPRLYDLCLRICRKMFERYGLEGREGFEFVFERGLGRNDSPYRRALHIEAEYLFNLNVLCTDMLPEVDKRILLRILNFNRVMLSRFTNLVSISEYLLRSIDKRDTFAIKQYTSFLGNMSDDKALFSELLTPAKKYLPAIAVLEGFSSIEARRKFVENVNKNSNFHIQNPNSFRVFRNLFHSCRISSGIKANFVDAYGSQSSEYRMAILDILVNCLDYDIASFDFIMGKLNDLPLMKADSLINLSPECVKIFKVLRRRVFSQPQPVREVILRYLMEHMHVPVVFHFVDVCVPISSEVSLMLTSFLNEYLSSSHSYRDQQLLSRAAYNILRYLKRRKCRFNDNKAVLLVYRDLNGIEYGVGELVNWYFKNFSVEDIEVLYRLDNSFLVTSESLLSKIVMVEPGPIKTWMLGCFRRHLFSGPHAELSNPFVDRCVSFYLKSTGTYDSEDPAFINSCPKDPDSEADSCQTGLFISGSDMEDDASLFYDCEGSDDSVDLFTRYNASAHRTVDTASDNDSTGRNVDIEELESSGTLDDEAKRPKVEVPYSKPTQSSNMPHTEAKKHDLSFLIQSFADNILPILDLFCEVKVYSKELVEMCKESLSSSYRYASLYYLCLFDPSPEYFELIFKLSYHERKYALPSLVTLVDRFGSNQLVSTIKTVIRSEMRFRTSEYVVVPLLLARRVLLEDKEVLFELCVLSHRLFSKGHLNYDLLSVINDSEVPAAFKRELNTITMIRELETGKFVILGKEREFDVKRVVLGAIRGPNKAKIFEPWLEDFDFDALGLKDDIIAVFLSNMMVTLPRKMVTWLDIPLETYLGSTLDNQISVLEVYLESCAQPQIAHQSRFFLNADVVMDLLSNLVTGRYSHLTRFGAMYCKLIGILPSRVSKFLLDTLKDGEFAYPPLFEYLPEVLELSEPEVAVKLAVVRPSNIPLDVFEANILHLFRVMPFSLDALKKEFFGGLVSKNRITRKCYLDMLFSHTSTDVFGTLQYILLFNYTGLEDCQAEYFIAALLYRALNLREPVPSVLPFVGHDSATSTSTIGRRLGGTPWYEFVSTKKDLFRYDLLYYSLDNQESIRSFLTGIFRRMDLDNIHTLYRMYCDSFACNSMRIKMPFIRAFISEGIKVNSLLYNPYHPSLKFYQLMDRPMYLGLVKERAGLRETKSIAEAISSGQVSDQDVLNSIFELLKKIDTRQASYNSEDVSILESEVLRIYAENGWDPRRAAQSNGISHYFCSGTAQGLLDSESRANLSATFSSSVAETTEVEVIERRFSALVSSIESEKISMDEVSSLLSTLPILLYVPRNSLMFSRLLMLSSIASEMIESSIILKDSLSDSIYGRFRMWMIRHPSFQSPFVDWSIFMKWRTFIFSKATELVSENDRKKISSEMCRLNCIYAMKAFKERLYQKSSFILNEMSSITTVEVSQNMQRILLDLENLYALEDYSTMISLINSLNITRFSNEDKSRLYFWAYKAFKRLRRGVESEKFGNLSRKLFDIIENKKEDLEILKERLRLKKLDHRQGTADGSVPSSGALGDGLAFAFTSKLIEIINESTVEDSRPYVIQLIQADPSQLDLVSHQKLYFFIPQIRSAEFLFAKNPLLRSSVNALEVFKTLSAKLTESTWDKKMRLGEMLRGPINKAVVDAVGELAADVFGRELGSMFRASRTRHSVHSFEKETALPGEFVYLRNRYDDIKTMEYIEDFCTDGCTFFVRNTDGTLCKVISSQGTSDSALAQFMQLASASVKTHSLDKLSFGIFSVPIISTAEASLKDQRCFSVHKSVDNSVDSFIKLQVFKKGMPLESVVTRYLSTRLSTSKLSAFVDSFMHWKDLFKSEVLERVVDFNDFYVFRRNFISSYSSLLCLQHILGCSDISLEDLYVERCSGYVCLRSMSGSKGKLYIRPNLSSMLGSEGLNGPLCMILGEFCRSFQSEDASRMVDFFFSSYETRSEIQERVASMAGKKTQETMTPQLVVGEMVDPKTGAGLCNSLMPWL